MAVKSAAETTCETPLESTGISDRRANQLFWLLLVSHCVIWTLVPILTQPNAPLDTLEMIYWGHEWELGYYKHPPLPGWLAEIAYHLGGNSIWPTYVLSQLGTAACFLAVFQIGKSALGSPLALISVLMLQASYYYNLTTPEFNNNVSSRAFWALSILCLFRGLKDHRALDWILTGAFLGLGMLCKYDTAILALLMVVFSVVHPRGRAAWKTPGPLLLLASSFLVFAPHLYWLWEHDFPTVRYFLQRSNHEKTWVSHLVNPLAFVVSQLAAILPVILLAVPLTGWRWRKAAPPTTEKAFARDFLLCFGLGPVLMVCLAGVVTGAQFRSMWGTAIWTFTGLALLASVQLRPSTIAMRRVATGGLSLGLLFVALLCVRNTVVPHFREKASRIHFPGAQLSDYARKLYLAEVGTEPVVAGGSRWEAANVACYGPQQLSVYINLEDEFSPWMNDDRFRQLGGLIVWNDAEQGAEYMADIQQRFPSAVIHPPVELQWQTSAAHPPLRFRIATLPPEDGREKLDRPANPVMVTQAADRGNNSPR